MPRTLTIDRAVYLVDDQAMTYRFLRRKPAWARLDREQNTAHKRQIDGYTRIFRDGRRKVFHYREG
jgi:hypothetical protein